MEENVTTLLEKWQKQQQDHPEWTPALEDLLYVIHGSGSDRDRLYSLEQLRNLIQTLFSQIIVSGLGAGSTKIDPGTIELYGGNGLKVKMQGGGYLLLTPLGIHLYSVSGSTETLEGSITFDDEAKTFKFSKAVDIDDSRLKAGVWSLLTDGNGDLHLKETYNNTTTTVVKGTKGNLGLEFLKPVTFSKGAALPYIIANDSVSLNTADYSAAQGYNRGTTIRVFNNTANAITVSLSTNDFVNVGAGKCKEFFHAFTSESGYDGDWVAMQVV